MGPERALVEEGGPEASDGRLGVRCHRVAMLAVRPARGPCGGQRNAVRVGWDWRMPVGGPMGPERALVEEGGPEASVGRVEVGCHRVPLLPGGEVGERALRCGQRNA